MLTPCREYRARLIEAARGAAGAEERRDVMAHIERCPECARAFDEQTALSAALDVLAGEAAPELAAIEARVLAEFDRAAVRRRAARWIWAAGLAAAAATGVVWMHRPAPVVQKATVVAPVPATVEAPAAVAPAAAPVKRAAMALRKETEAPFLAIPYTVPPAPEEPVSIVQMQVPIAALIAAGYQVDTSDPGAVVSADVLVSQDGRARAIRFHSN